MPKAMIDVTVQRKQGEPWGMVIVGGKDQALTVKLGRIKVNFTGWLEFFVSSPNKYF